MKTGIEGNNRVEFSGPTCMGGWDFLLLHKVTRPKWQVQPARAEIQLTSLVKSDSVPKSYLCPEGTLLPNLHRTFMWAR